MDHKRYKRLRVLVKGLNKQRKRQAQKTDILCNDLITAHRGFIENLKVISFAANFYEAIIAISDLSGLFQTASSLLRTEIPDVNIAFFLRKHDKISSYPFESVQPIEEAAEELQKCFTPDLVDHICKANKVCTMDTLLEMGLQAGPAVVNKLSAITVPLGEFGSCLGFILVCRELSNPLAAAELEKICSVTCGLSRAVESCQQPLHTAYPTDILRPQF